MPCWLKTLDMKVSYLLEDLDLHILQAIDLVLFTEQRADAFAHGLHTPTWTLLKWQS